MHLLGPARGLALSRGVTREKLSQDEVLLGPAEQPGAGIPPQRGALAQDTETECLVGAGQRFGRGATDPGSDAVAQICGRSPRSCQDQALFWRDLVTAHPVNHDLDRSGRLAGARSAEDTQDPRVTTLRGGSAVAGSVVDDGAIGDGCSLGCIQDRGLGTQTGSPSQCQHRQIPSRRTDGDASEAGIQRTPRLLESATDTRMPRP